MKKEVAEKWVKALRSGEFKQTRKVLSQDDHDGAGPSFCCLGVLCEISGKGSWDIHRNYVTDTGTACQAMPPFEVENDFARFNERASLHDLSNLNDKGQSFAEIAAYIERNQERL